jgi:hypothetical protein
MSAHGACARRAAAKIVAREQNRRALIPRLIQKKTFITGTVGAIPPVRKQSFAQTGPFDGFQILLGNDLVSINIDSIKRSNQTFECSKSVHNAQFLVLSFWFLEGVLEVVVPCHCERSEAIFVACGSSQ